MSFLGYARYAPRIFRKRGTDPLYLIFFVTDRCNARCPHCLLGSGKPTGEGELSLDEYEKIAEGMGPFLFLLLTGGEPFLREDLADIARVFVKKNGVRNLGIPTNGSLTERVLEGTRRILAENPGLDFAVDVSLDGIGEEHDRLRGVPGLFEKATRTLRELQTIERENAHFNANVCITMTGFNQDRVAELTRYVREKLKVRNVNNLVARPGARDDHALDVDPEIYGAWVRDLRHATETKGLAGYHDYPGADVVNAMKNLRQDLVLRELRREPPLVSCTAATLAGVVYPNGDVYPCEVLRERIGNLREHGYDFRRVWFSERGEEVRRMIRETHCHCTFECFLTNNILFQPRMLPRVAWEWARLKTRRALSRKG
ncbi:MAG: radical SAM protein [Candidatus Eisenbacteria bacterium]|nr:radical SAM protein [Candidatus Eisenbacteria bacterium]